MRVLHTVAALLLAALATAAASLYIGSQEQHYHKLAKHPVATFGLHLYAGLLVGLAGLAG